MDIVFYGGSLNYDQGSGNYQELKKITMYDGSVKILVSRWALRYSMLEMGKDKFNWKLAQGDDLQLTSSGDSKGVVNPKYDKFIDDNKYKTDENDLPLILNYPEFDLFGFMITKEKGEEKGKGLTRTTPVKISHAISLNTYNFDTQFMANLGMMKRAGGEGSNPVNIEEFYGFYVYNVTFDLHRIGVLDDYPDKPLPFNERKKRVFELIDIIMTLKRDIKGKREDLSPWIVIAGVYDNLNYDTYMDRIELIKKERQRIERLEKEEETPDGKLRIIEYIKEEDCKPKFKLNITQNDVNNGNAIIIFYKNNVEIEDFQSNNSYENKSNENQKIYLIKEDKNEFIKKIEEAIVPKD
ncbi:MAG: type I-B CRISPR-associated protein Cas7/Cst2/DevR [candidate division WOR-3 bacterium]